MGRLQANTYGQEQPEPEYGPATDNESYYNADPQKEFYEQNLPEDQQQPLPPAHQPPPPVPLQPAQTGPARPDQYPPPSPQANPAYSTSSAQYPPPSTQINPASFKPPAQYPPQSPQNNPVYQTQLAHYPPPGPHTGSAYPNQHAQYPPQSPQGQYPAAQMRSPLDQPSPAQYPPPPVQFPPATGAPTDYRGVPPSSPHKPIGPANGAAQGIPIQGQFPVVQNEEWSTGLFDCMDDPNNALVTACFPCVTFGQVAEIVDNGHTSCATSGILYCLIGALIYVPCIFSCTYRTKLRAKYGLLESPAPDWATHFLCEHLALCQEYRELQHRGMDPAIGWMGNVARNQNTQLQQASMVPPMNQRMMD